MEELRFYFKNLQEIEDCLFNQLQIQKSFSEDLSKFRIQPIDLDGIPTLVICRRSNNDSDVFMDYLDIKHLVKRQQYDLIHELVIKLKIAIDYLDKKIFVNQYVQTQDIIKAW